MCLDDDEFPAEVPNDLTSASFHPSVLCNGSGGVGEKNQTAILKNAGYDLRMTVPSSSSESVELIWNRWTDKHSVLLGCFSVGI